MVALRPLGVGEMLDGAIATVRTHPRVMLGFSAAVATVATTVQSLGVWVFLRDTGANLTDPAYTPDSGDVARLLASFSASTGLTLLVQLVATAVLTGIITVVISNAVLGRPISLVDAWRVARRRLFPLVLVSLFFPLTVLAVLAVGIGPTVALGVSGLTWAAVLWALGSSLAGICVIAYAWVKLATVGPAVVLENRGPIAATRRSARLVSRSFWRVFGIEALVVVISQVFSSIFAVPFALLAGGTGIFTGQSGTNPYEALPLFITSVGQVIGATLALPFAAAVTVLLYVDLRMRREGLDIELQRAAGYGVPGISGTPGAATPGPASFRSAGS